MDELKDKIIALHHAFYRDKSPLDALDYIAACREWIKHQQPEPIYGHAYKQHPHSGDPNPVGGDRLKPAMLNACYANHFGRDFLSFSVPLGVRQDVDPKTRLPYKFDSQTDTFSLVPGYNVMSLAESYFLVLKTLGVHTDNETKYGYCIPEMTNYAEQIAKTHADYQRGFEITHAIVHGDAASDATLRQRLEKAIAVTADMKATKPEATGWMPRLAGAIARTAKQLRAKFG